MSMAATLPCTGSGTVTSFSKVVRLQRCSTPAEEAATSSLSRPAANLMSSAGTGRYLTIFASLTSKTASFLSWGRCRITKRPPPPRHRSLTRPGKARSSLSACSGAGLIGPAGGAASAGGSFGSIGFGSGGFSAAGGFSAGGGFSGPSALPSGGGGGGGGGASALSLTATLKVWKISCPEASLTVRITSTSPSAKSAGTLQVSLPSADTFMPCGPDSSLYLTPPFFDFTASG